MLRGKMKYSEKDNGYLTVYLALIMTVLISLYLALIEGARSNAIRLEAECVMDIALNSVLAEYHRELYNQYNLFAIDTSYGTSLAGTGNVEEHLRHYLDRNLSLEDVLLKDFFYRDFLAMSVKSLKVTRASILTDEEGAIFRKRAVEAIKDDVGITLMEELTDWMNIVNENGLVERDIASEKKQIDEKLDSYDGMEIEISEEKSFVVDIDNPTEKLEGLRRFGILDVVVDRPENISRKAIAVNELISHRMEQEQISKGNYSVEELSGASQFAERFFFQEYLLKYMGRYDSEDEENALSYQVEYLVSGNSSDVENLRETVNKLCALREVANAVYLYSDEVKCAEAESIATLLAALFQVPEIATLLKHTLLLGWAYAESLYDVEVLLKGGRIPLIKDGTSWHYDLQGALDMRADETNATAGLSYEDYLRILMYLVDMDVLTVRAMDIIETDIRLTPGNKFFRMDGCFDCVETVVYIKSEYGYEYEITRQKKY